MKLYQALVITDRRSDGSVGSIAAVRVSSTYYRDDAAAKKTYGTNFVRLLTDEKHTIKI